MMVEDRDWAPSSHSKKWDEEDRRNRESALYGPGYHPNTSPNSHYGDFDRPTQNSMTYKKSNKSSGGIFGSIFKIAIIVVISYYIISVSLGI